MGRVGSVCLFSLREHTGRRLAFCISFRHWVTFIASKNFLHDLWLILVIDGHLGAFASWLRTLQLFPESWFLPSWATWDPRLVSIWWPLFFCWSFSYHAIALLRHCWPSGSPLERQCSMYVPTWWHRRLFDESCEQRWLIGLTCVWQPCLVAALSVYSLTRSVRQHRRLIIDGTTEGALLHHLSGKRGILGFCLIHDGFTDQKDVLLEIILGPYSTF